ncbi:hypothetical protein TNCV_2939551 [Trichonephila clavipes]|nr:hypothetical protein TNCV_2939551 [Trichonephila clavipes]
MVKQTSRFRQRGSSSNSGVDQDSACTHLVIDDAAGTHDENAESPMVKENSETTGKDNLDEDITVPPKIKPIMLRYKDNYNMVHQALNRKFPKSTNKLTGQYIKNLASTTDEHREITTLLKSKGEGILFCSPTR